ncbi:hypothetical protein [Gordonia phthalatica]|uniref:hypothetical protein n=1 Tax=Gordonia phthalatica TaxID=1136941 RepID=UPI00078456C4|nr:hypothetical protein [Gordonia phthalatica]
MTQQLNPLRRSYEARVLVVPLGTTGGQMTDDIIAMGIDGIRILRRTDSETLTVPVGPHAWEAAESASVVNVVQAADMVVLVGSDLSEIDERLIGDVAAAAEGNGAMITAVLVASSKWETPEGASAMRRLRSDADMLVEVRGPGLLAALVDVLRGGARTEDVQPRSEAVR